MLKSFNLEIYSDLGTSLQMVMLIRSIGGITPENYVVIWAHANKLCIYFPYYIGHFCNLAFFVVN